APPVDNENHLYVLDGWGGVHPVGASPQLATTTTWPNKDFAYSLALFPDASGGYVLDGWGGLHPVGLAPAVDSHVSWPNWIGAREVVMAPWSSTIAPAGYVLDADRGIHPFGGPPQFTRNTSWPGPARTWRTRWSRGHAPQPPRRADGCWTATARFMRGAARPRLRRRRHGRPGTSLAASRAVGAAVAAPSA